MVYIGRLVCIALALALMAATANAQPAYPAKPVRFLVGAPAGGSNDIFARAISQRLSEALGPPVIVVQGNNDFAQFWPLEVSLKRNGLSFRLIHIPPPVAKFGRSDILLHGHTHVPRDEIIQGMRVLNPGTVSKPNHGVPPSYAWLTISPERKIGWEIVPVTEPQ